MLQTVQSAMPRKFNP